MRTILIIGRNLILFLLPFILFQQAAYCAAQAETERLVRSITPPSFIVKAKPEKKGEIFADSYWENHRVLQGTRTGYWSELTNRFGYRFDTVTGYMSFSQFERFDDGDNTANFGAYINMKNAYAHMEVGFAWDVTYMYKLQTITEYGHKLYKDLYWQLGYSYRSYSAGDTHIVYPGLIYYFGDSYISGDWGISYIEGRDTAYFGAIKGTFVVTDFLSWWCGISVGERLYDIYGLDAREEVGTILFAGVTMRIYKEIKGRVGYSYGEEGPKFIKRGVSFDLTAKF